MQKQPNHLINESSPYLLQHAYNPVDWYPWGEEALNKARQENKLLIISIGYAACHWCHVMEHESFEDKDVAALMNDKFVSIKVDREERPDIDQVYMQACQLISGRGGWPLNAIALPDGSPVYAGTYFPKQQWMNLLRQLYDFCFSDPPKAKEYALQLKQGIQMSEMITARTDVQAVTNKEIEGTFRNLINTVDFKKGGRGGAPKFPMPVNYNFLLKYHFLLKEKEALKAVEITLDNIANGGIYDHLGGGFARYSVDDEWHVPHFEKMLYDNGQLVSLFSFAYQATKKELYRKVVYETLEWVKREMTAPENGFYSALDADSEGVEGKFYCWTADEIKSILKNDAPVFMDYYDVTEHGNWEENNNVLRRKKEAADIAKEHQLSEAVLSRKIEDSKKILFAAREKRVRPGLDDKQLTSWNALMLKGYADAYRVFRETEFLDNAVANACFLLEKMSAGGNLKRNYKNGKATIDAFLDDYALLIEALLSLYTATFNEEWLNEAARLTEIVNRNFYDENSGMYFFTSTRHETLIARKMELSDNVIPASNSVMAQNLFSLGHYLEKPDYLSRANQMFNNVKQDALQHPSFYANWASLALSLYEAPFEVVIVGDDCLKIREELDKHYLPNLFLMGGKTEGDLPLLQNRLVQGQTTIYLCKEKTCQLPVTKTEDALKQLMYNESS